MPDPVQPDQVLLNVQYAQDLFKNFHEWYRYYIDQAGAQTEKAIEINKQLIAAHERLLLIDVGTIGLSVSALIALAGKFPPHVSRAPFVTLLVSAWAFLFVSAVSFNGAIAQLIIVNSHVFKSWTKLLESYNAQIVGLSLSKLSNALTGTVRIEEKDHNVKELFSDFAGKIREAGQTAFEERQKIHDAAPASLQAPLVRYARIAHFSMRLGFVLLCIAAIKGFLAV